MRAPTKQTGPQAALSKRALVHELQVHQVELEQQNEELRRAYGDLAVARDRFVDLFDFAPVGYLTLDRRGCIIEANLTAAGEFGTNRLEMLGSPFMRFIAPSDGDRWQRLTAAAFRRSDRRRIELALLRQDGRQFQAQLDCARVVRAGSKPQLRVTLTDISQRQLAERNRRIATAGSAARETERLTVARQLHEDLGQRLGALKMKLGSLESPEGSASHRELVGSMAAEIDQALALVRRMSTDLHPLMLHDLGLNAALEWLAGNVASRLGLTVELHLDDDACADEPLAIAVYRLSEMALEHFALHADAGISLELLRRPRDWVLQFQIVPGHARNEALPGKAMMEMSESFLDQLHLLGGRLEVSELPGEIRRLCVFINTRPAGAAAPPPRDAKS